MDIQNSQPSDLPFILDLYANATAYMKSKNQVAWPEIPKDLILTEINENRQWKLLVDNQVAGIWATTLSDELIWGEKNADPSVYIHRIAVNPELRGQQLVAKIVNWAKGYARENNLEFIRLDTVGSNEGLIKLYQENGFDFLGLKTLPNTDGLPGHYKLGPVCLFQIEVPRN